MYSYRLSIQENIKLFNIKGLVGETTIEKIEDFCMKNHINIPKILDENDSVLLEIVKQYFEEQ